MPEGRRGPTSRPWFVLALCALLAACSGAPATQAPATGTATGAPPSQGAGTESFEPSSDQPISTGALPVPSLDTIDDIVIALGDPAQAEQVVVSMLSLLGIGLYQADAAPIRKGTEASDADFYAFEPMARGLVEMLRRRDDPGEQTSFRDYHAGLVSIGYEGSPEQLATAYATAYAGQPDAPMSRLIEALGPVDVDATLPEFELWLLMLDGFIPPNGAATAVAMSGNGMPAVAAGGAGWGVARRNITSPTSTWVHAHISLQLRAVVRTWRISLTASPASFHEGHGRPGERAIFTARLVGPSPELRSPFDGHPVVPTATGPAGTHVAWIVDSDLSDHGLLESPLTTVDGSGQTTSGYVPRQEPANGRGIERAESGTVQAKFLYGDLAQQLYGSFSYGVAGTLTGYGEITTVTSISWHEVAEGAVRIEWTDEYNGVGDTITFVGNLDASERDPVTGKVTIYTGHGTATGSRSGWAACNPGITVVPSGTSTATFSGIIQGETILISAYVDFGTPLVGVSTAPIEVSIYGGTGYFTSQTVAGEECKHAKFGTLTYGPIP